MVSSTLCRTRLSLTSTSPTRFTRLPLTSTSPTSIFHKSNLHLPCTVPGTNLSVATKRGLEYPQHITVSVQNPVNRKVQPVETWRFELTSQEASGCAYSTDLNVGTPWLDFTTAVSQYVDKAVGSTHRLWALLQAAGQDQGNRPWDLEEGGGLGRESQPRPVETLNITSPLSYIPTHLSACLTNPVTTPLFPSAE